MEGGADHPPPPAAAVKLEAEERAAGCNATAAPAFVTENAAPSGATPTPDAAPGSVPAANGDVDDDADDDADALAEEEEEEEEEEEPWEDQLADALAEVGPSGAFAFSGTVDKVPAFAPAVTVEGLGRLVLPLCAEQAAALRAVAEPAPFGRGAETVLDEAVRRARQVPAARLTVAPASWSDALARTVARAAAAMGIEDAAAMGVTAQLDKLVLYEPGGHFAPHKDTEKAAGMFGTLVIQLPCVGGHAGGELAVRHQGRHVRVDFAKDSTRDVFPFAAFFADCTHELTPLTAGVRLALLYNLVHTTPGAPPAPIDSSAADDALAAAASA
jgi:predicted 2-oxoglutarate/Fe(II)-dependent dioxygenase YbiX